MNVHKGWDFPPGNLFWGSFTNHYTGNYLRHGINITTNQRLSPTFRGLTGTRLSSAIRRRLLSRFFLREVGTSVHRLHESGYFWNWYFLTRIGRPSSRTQTWKPYSFDTALRSGLRRRPLHECGGQNVWFQKCPESCGHAYGTMRTLAHNVLMLNETWPKLRISMQFCMDQPHSSTIKHECETMLTNLHYSIPSLDKSKIYRYLAKRRLLSSLRAHKKRLWNVNLKTR